MKRSYLDYSLSVIIGRALPDVRDGLKPVHRRILYTMQQMGLAAGPQPRASAPASSAKSWASTIRMETSPFMTRWCGWRSRLPCAYPLVDGQGNFGSVDGDPPAADRYTEARLTRVSTALLEDLDKEAVDFYPNYDGTEIAACGSARALFPTCWSTARTASRWAWRPRFRRTT